MSISNQYISAALMYK